MWLPAGQKVRYNRWRKFDRIFFNGTVQKRFIREIIFGKRRAEQFWEITTDPETLPKNSTWCVMTRIPNLKYHQVGNLYGLRNWVEYGLKQSKNEHEKADFRITNYAQIPKWWEIVMSAYLMVSLHAKAFNQSQTYNSNHRGSPVTSKFSLHPGWNEQTGWKNLRFGPTFSTPALGSV